MKIVLDTNVVVSGLLQAQGNPAQVLSLVLSGAIQICYDERILAEFETLARFIKCTTLTREREDQPKQKQTEPETKFKTAQKKTQSRTGSQ